MKFYLFFESGCCQADHDVLFWEFDTYEDALAEAQRRLKETGGHGTIVEGTKTVEVY